ncbi:lipopolysaccharide biosynthesis protein [Ferruginibacter sp.]
MRKKFLDDVSASSLQVIFNQGLGLLIFLLTSRFLSKPVYGEFNWSLAVMAFVTAVLSLRLEQIVVRKVAAGDDPSKMLSLFLWHSIFGGVFFYAALLIAHIIFPAFFQQHNLLLLLAISQLTSFFTSPFKQLANGQEFFRPLAIMSSVANVIRAVWLLIIVLFNSIDIQQVIIIYIVSALAELLVCFYIVQFRLKVAVKTSWSSKDYFLLLQESLPQIGVVFLNALIARFDWILLGIWCSSVVTAEYSFAYKVFELCPLPMLILGPILLSRFSRYFSNHTETSLTEKKRELGFFIRYAMIAATLLPLMLNVIWGPVADVLTGYKYGAVNKITFLLLSLCIPFQYMINLLWTIQFAQNHLKRILKITVITGIVIVAGDLLMIPLLNAKGAATVYLVATTIEYLVYLRSSILIKIKESWLSVAVCLGIALASGFAVEYLHIPLVMKLLAAVALYLLLLVVTRQVKKNDWKLVREWV